MDRLDIAHMLSLCADTEIGPLVVQPTDGPWDEVAQWRATFGDLHLKSSVLDYRHGGSMPESGG